MQGRGGGVKRDKRGEKGAGADNTYARGMPLDEEATHCTKTQQGGQKQRLQEEKRDNITKGSGACSGGGTGRRGERVKGGRGTGYVVYTVDRAAAGIIDLLCECKKF